MTAAVPRAFLAAAVTAWAVAAPSAQATLRSQLIGQWRLVGTETHRDGHPPEPTLGAEPVGAITYTADGHMQAQLTLGVRPRVRAADATADEIRGLARYTAYFGTFTVDEAARTVTHRRQGTFAPGERDFVRSIALSGNRLTLTTPATVVNGERRYSTIRWERLPAAPTRPGFGADARQAVAGTWALVDHRTLLPGGEIRRAFGPTPAGLFFFSPDGHTAVQIMNPERPTTPLDRATADDLLALTQTYLGYFGTFDVDAATRKIVVHTTADLNPMNTGADQIRYFTLDGDQMVLEPPPTEVNGGRQVSRITWRRVG